MKSQRIRFFLRRFFRRRELEDDLQEELNSHLAMDVRERMERGEQPLQAQAAARRQFGNLGLVKDVARDNWGFGWLEQAMQDVRYALRTLRQAPLFTVTLVLTLALGLGSTTAIFSVVDAILLRPLPFSQPERLAMIWEIPPGSKKPNVVALNNFVAWKQRSRSFESMAAFFQLPMNLLGDGETEQVPGLAVTSEFFQVLGTPPLLGRVFRPAEYFRDEPKEVILTYGTWQRLFGGRMDVIGKRISINVSHHEIIGVMPPGFGLENYRADLYVPLAINFEEGRNYSVVGRLRENVTATAARADIAAIAIQTARENQNLNAGWSAMVISLLEQTVGNFRLILLVFFASVLLLLLIACANVANLLLMRGIRRSREISVRFALGAGTARIVRQLLVESVVLSGIGGILGIGFAWLALRLVIANVPPSASIPRLHEAALNPTIVCFGIVLSLATGILFGLAPAVQASKPDLVHALHESSRSVTSGRKMRRALVVVEIALSFILAAAAGLMIRSFVRLADVNPGFHAEHVLTARMLLLPVQKQEWRADAVDQMLQGIRALPGVIAAGSIGILPMEG
ncbi:MAG: ABC transporter permease, partial [Acidobacteriaceae bacterium]|nr:ABC transporter permease [Acidobacteriaceae bacterium]